MTNYTDKKNNALANELGLSAKELAALMAPSEALNYDEWLSHNVDEYEISAEELEEVIALGVRLSNHDETLVSDAIRLNWASKEKKSDVISHNR